MKRILTLFLCLPLLTMAQETTTLKSSQKVSVEEEANLPNKVYPQQTASEHKGPKPPVAYKKLNEATDMVQVGFTYADLQTNGAPGRRVIAYDNGKVSVVWTTSHEADVNSNERGTGYNHFNGNSWLPLAGIEERIEVADDIQLPNRIGWPNINYTSSNEYTITHSATNGGFVLTENDAIGGTNWSSREIFQNGPIWARTAQGGNDYVYMLANYSTLTGGGDKIIDGITNPTVYFRSDDNGQAWINSEELLPGYDTSRYRFGAADSYAIDAQDNVVVMLIGSGSQDLAMWKSTDYGDNWTKTVIYEFPIAPRDKDEIFDSISFYDGSVDVVLDDQNNAHVFYGIRSIQNDEDVDTSLTFSYFFDNNGMGYWNEVTQTHTRIAELVDEIGGGIPTSMIRGNFPTNGGIQYGNNMLVTFPTSTIDENDNIYCFYSARVMLDDALLDANYSDIYVVYSEDGGATWSNEQNLTKTAVEWGNQNNPFPLGESVFPSVARRTVNGEAKLIWQEDAEVGTSAQNQHGVSDGSYIMFASIDVDRILNNEFGETGVGIVKKSINNVFSLGQNFPNPFSGNTTVELEMNKPAVTTITVTDMVGKMISTETRNLSSGTHNISLSAERLNAGVYFYTVEAGDFSATRRMMVR
ncbi:MAG: T9SS type A sorting domain-containing protein [Bacteroidia bacterium]